jgi:hypothetical protein
MAIFSSCSDIETRQLSWIGRDVETGKLDFTQPMSSVAIAAQYAKAYASDVRVHKWAEDR